MNEQIITIEKSIILSKWCVECYPKKERAEFTYDGDSLCEKCFKDYKEFETAQ